MAPSNSSNQTTVRLLLILMAALILFALVTYYNRTHRPPTPERFSTTLQPAAALDMSAQPHNIAPPPAPSARGMPPARVAQVPIASEPLTNELYRPVPGSGGALQPKDSFPQDRLRPEDLLPKDAANSRWAQVNPAGQGDVKDQNFLTAGHHIGVDTVGQSLRNSSHDIRSTPPNPRYKISIWQQSTITPDLSRRPLE
jgi:hypothetical protein